MTARWPEAEAARNAWRNILGEIKWHYDLTPAEQRRALRVWAKAREAEQDLNVDPPTKRAQA